MKISYSILNCRRHQDSSRVSSGPICLWLSSDTGNVLGHGVYICRPRNASLNDILVEDIQPWKPSACAMFQAAISLAIAPGFVVYATSIYLRFFVCVQSAHCLLYQTEQNSSYFCTHHTYIWHVYGSTGESHSNM